MPKKLDVYLHRDRVGQLVQTDEGAMSFIYAADWITRADARPLSHSLPLRAERFNRKECQGFFAGILPEEAKREVVAKNLGVSAGNDFALLERLGGECAGAVTFVTAGAGLPEREYGYRPLTPKRLAEILRELPRRPLLAGEDGIRLSLAEILLAKIPSMVMNQPETRAVADLVQNRCMRIRDRFAAG